MEYKLNFDVVYSMVSNVGVLWCFIFMVWIIVFCSVVNRVSLVSRWIMILGIFINSVMIIDVNNFMNKYVIFVVIVVL